MKKNDVHEKIISVFSIAGLMTAFISLITTQQGLKQYTFSKDWQAFFISFSIQSALFVCNMKGPEILKALAGRKKFVLIFFYTIVLMSSSCFSFVYIVDAMPYNIHEYIAEICDSFRNVLAQVTDINKEYVSVSFIYHYIYKNVSEDDKNWKWIVGREQTMQTPLNQFVEKENTVYHTLIKGSETVVFYNDKQSMAEVGRYYMSARDERHSRIGSIFGVQLMFSNNAELFVEGVMVVSTYGKKFVPSNDINKINQLKRLVIDDLLPSYQRMLETEMGMLYLRHLDSESCLQQRQHWGQRLHRKNKELWKKR